MKTISIFAISVMLLSAGNLSAQVDHKKWKDSPKEDNMGQMRTHESIMNFTEDQKAKMKDLRVAFQKTVQPLHNQLGELKAKQHTLATSDKIDMKAINANIDEITKVQNLLMKALAAHNQDIRILLTDEQRVQFDSKRMDRRDHGKMRHSFSEVGASNSESPAHLPE